MPEVPNYTFKHENFSLHKCICGKQFRVRAENSFKIATHFTMDTKTEKKKH